MADNSTDVLRSQGRMPFIPVPRVEWEGPEKVELYTDDEWPFTLTFEPELGMCCLQAGWYSVFDARGILETVTRRIVGRRMASYPQRMFEYKLRVYGPMVGKVVAPILKKWREGLSPRVVEVHKALFSLKGRWPHKYAVGAALALEYPGDLGLMACKLACWDTFGPVDAPWNWQDGMYGDVLTRLQRRALARVPGGVSYHHVVAALQNMTRLPTKYRRRWILLGILHGEGVEVVERSSDRQIDKAYKMLVEHLHLDRPRRLQSIDSAWRFMVDAPPPESRQATVVAWAREAIEWHQQELWGRVRHTPDADVPFQPLPTTAELPPGFRYLDTPAALIEEGQRMHHCVGLYAQTCRQGHSFIFNYRDQVTLEVGWGGTVLQAYGPRNTVTEEVERAKAILQDWCYKHWEGGDASKDVVLPF